MLDNDRNWHFLHGVCCWICGSDLTRGGNAGSEADSSRGKQHGGKEEDEGEGEREKEEAELPQWEGTCLLDGKEVPLDRMVSPPLLSAEQSDA